MSDQGAEPARLLEVPLRGGRVVSVANLGYAAAHAAPSAPPPRRARVDARESLVIPKGRAPSSPRVPAAVRSVGAGLLAAAAAAFFVSRLAPRLPLPQWLFFQLAKIWAWNVVLAVTCASAGAVVVAKLLPADERTGLETLALAFPTGVVIFVMGMFVGGWTHAYGHAFAVIWPALLLAVTGRRSLALWRQARALTAPRGAPAVLPVVLSVLGVLLVGVLYLGAMTPAAINYDASWMHMVIAQDYAREGRIIPFLADHVKNLPHLGPMLETWSFLVPGLDVPALRWMMALHTELALFFMTLVGIAALARWFAERAVPATWTALLLFPGIFVYDSNIGGAADHVLAFFAAPVVLATAKALRRYDRRAAVLVGLLAGGALMTKLQAIYMLVPLGIWAVGRAVVLGARGRRSAQPTPRLAEMAAAMGIALAAAVLVFAPHLLTNLIFFHNPMYPLLQDVFTSSRPTLPDAAEQVRVVLADWTQFPPAALGARIKNALAMAFTFSFVPHYSFSNGLPVFGSMFTLSLPLLLAIPRCGRLRSGALLTLGALVTWAMSYLVDRNLQTFLPLIVAVTAAIFVRAWELGCVARGGIGLLVVAQVAWATPLYFSGVDRVSDSLSLLRSGFDGTWRSTLAAYRRNFVALGESLPKDAVVVMHVLHPVLGIDRTTLLDFTGFQSLIDYRTFKTARDLYDRLRAVGATHVVWTPGRAAVFKQEEIIFDVFAQSLPASRPFGDMVVAAMPAVPPPAEPPYPVLSVGMPGYPDGLYSVDSLNRNDMYPPALRHQGVPKKTAAAPGMLLDEAKVVLISKQASLDGAAHERLAREFREIQLAPEFRVLLRR